VLEKRERDRRKERNGEKGREWEGRGGEDRFIYDKSMLCSGNWQVYLLYV